MTGILRKKGLFFLNERQVSISRTGVLSYFHFDNLQVSKAVIDLSSVQVQSVRFQYHSTQQKNNRPAPNIDDEFRIYMQNRETFIFRASKAAHGELNPDIAQWESVIRKFAKNVKVIS